MCFDRQSAGMQPWCVATCAATALEVVESFDINESGVGAPEIFADKALTKPAIKFTGPNVP
jgi:Fe-S-cluster-containing dehydrogenase component